MRYLITTFTLCCCMGCVPDYNNSPTANELIIYGQQINDYCSSNKSRVQSYLEEGSKASFFSRGNIEADGNILTLNESVWKNNEPLTYNETQDQSQISVYCPPLPNQPASWHQANGQLLDLLVSQTTCHSGKPIKLNFSHLFSKLIFQLDNELNKHLQTLTCSIIPDIATIEPFEASIITNNKQSYSLTFHADKANKYSILVPPVQDITLNIKIETTDGRKFEKELSTITCEKGTAYLYQIKEKGNAIGIYTAEDFIAFSYLINKRPYQKRSLKEFGSTKDGVTTYYLRDNISFTDDQRKRIQQCIQEDQDPNSFNEIFDGMGHQLENLLIKQAGPTFSALFPNLGETGVIKNLTLKKVELYRESYNSGLGILSCQSKGLIDNCHVINAQIYSESTCAAAICTYNAGTIMNSSAKSITFKSNNGANYDLEFGGITEHNLGKILNSYASQIKCDNEKQHRNASSALCQVNDGIISNCYTDLYDPKLSPICCSNKNTINYCYNTSAEKTRNIVSGQTLSNKELVARLNKWIINKAPKLYQNYTFLHWKIASNSIVTFDYP